MDNDLKWALVAIAAIILVPLFGANYYVKQQCYRYAHNTGMAVEYKMIGGCYIEVGEKFVPYSEYKLRVATSGVEESK